METPSTAVDKVVLADRMLILVAQAVAGFDEPTVLLVDTIGGDEDVPSVISQSLPLPLRLPPSSLGVLCPSCYLHRLHTGTCDLVINAPPPSPSLALRSSPFGLQ